MHPSDTCPQLAALDLANPHVRDLAWACFGPALLQVATLPAGDGVTDTKLALTTTRAAWLRQLDRQPQPLLSWLQARPVTRLGLYFETLWQFFLTEDSDTALLAYNVPVRSSGQTLGEFDCLYYCRRREKPVHLELAVKFYLGHRSTTPGAQESTAAEWLGPNTVDRLDLKLTRLLTHQSRLSLHPAGRELLAQRGLEQPLREIALRGALFQPVQDALSPPPGYNTALPLGGWQVLQQWRNQVTAQARFVLLPRLRWLSPVQASNETQSADELQAQLEQHFARGGRPLLVARVDDMGCELERHFLASDRWPER
jgi:uncharacterized protein